MSYATEQLIKARFETLARLIDGIQSVVTEATPLKEVVLPAYECRPTTMTYRAPSSDSLYCDQVFEHWVFVSVIPEMAVKDEVALLEAFTEARPYSQRLATYFRQTAPRLELDGVGLDGVDDLPPMTGSGTGAYTYYDAKRYGGIVMTQTVSYQVF